LTTSDGVEDGYPYREEPPAGVIGWYEDLFARAETQPELKPDISAAITNLGVFDIGDQGLSLIEFAPGVSLEEICDRTEPELLVASMASRQGDSAESHEETTN